MEFLIIFLCVLVVFVAYLLPVGKHFSQDAQNNFTTDSLIFCDMIKILSLSGTGTIMIFSVPIVENGSTVYRYFFLFVYFTFKLKLIIIKKIFAN